MADYTENLNLKKPARTDYFSVADFNNNADIIDSAVKNISDSIPSGGFPLEKSSTTIFNNDGSITETFLDNSYKTTVFNSNGSITETYSNSLGVVQNTKQTVFNNDGSITVTIN